MLDMMRLSSAHADVGALEDELGISLHQEPVGLSDQWAAGVRDLFGELGVNISDSKQAHPAFVGAYIIASMMIPASMCSEAAVVNTTYILRHLIDRSIGE